jgi:rare lipoprotein A
MNYQTLGAIALTVTATAAPMSAIASPVNERTLLLAQVGQASFYGNEGGPKTANGERYNPGGLTAAHRTLPFGTKVRVTNVRNGRSVVVRINDRGPFIGGRIIDLSTAAAGVIGLTKSGIGQVRLNILGR